MVAIISPAKSLQFDQQETIEYTLSRMPSETKELVGVMQEKSTEDLKKLMNISDNLAELNAERFHSFSQRHTEKNAKPCIFTFNGDVYQGLDAGTLTEEEVDYAQDHLRILSGLYGLLRPKDLIQPYRLEMGTKLAFDDYNTLYDFWGDKIAKLLNKDLKAQGDDIIVNLASNEYFNSIKKSSLKARIIDVEFKDFKNGQYKIISFYAKKARGLMSRFIIKNKISNPEDLKMFDYEDYRFDDRSSTDNKLVFLRG